MQRLALPSRLLIVPALALPMLLASLPAAADTVPEQVRTTQGPVRVETLASGLEHPWALAFLPDGRMLVTERPGRLRLVGPDGRVSEPLRGVPEVFAKGQGGLLDVALSPDFATDRLVYLTYAEPGPGDTAGTAAARARLSDDATALENMTVIFRQMPKLGGPNHFGARLAFTPDGNLFVTLGERFKFDPAQDPRNHLGTLVRIRPNGAVPPDNPFVGRDDARPETWSYGHRNIQGAAVQPGTGTLWINEYGPLGGDELNIPEPGRNYGWPLVSWGRHYDGRAIPAPSTRPDLAGSVRQWTPVISPSGMTFYEGAAFPGWQGDLLIAGLTSHGIVRLDVAESRVGDEERIELGVRIRDVAVGPDGSVHALVDQDDGAVLRLVPADAARTAEGR